VSDLPDLFLGFEARKFTTKGEEIFARLGGSGPPLLLLHGYPQTHHAWHRIAPALAERFSLVIADLRGYGQSSCPPSDAEHFVYSKRAMGEDMVEVMDVLGHDRFSILGHDRGARVAYRMALDHPERMDRLALLDILPTYVMWQNMNHGLAMSAYHWPFLAQPHPMPETLIGKAPEYYVEHTLASWALPKDLSVFDKTALAHYRALLASDEKRHAACEDYRAGESYDATADEADLKAGRKIACPTLVLWGTDYVAKRAASPLDVWQDWCDDVRGESIVSGHFLAEEAPEEVLKALVPFLSGG
jgi:haloacetate dehalogenase